MNSKLHLNGTEIELLRSHKRKTLSLEVDHHGVKVRAPNNMRLRTICKFVESKQKWIDKHLNAMPTPPMPIIIEDGAELNFLGRKIKLKLLNGRSSPRLIQQTESDHDILEVPIVVSHLTSQETAKRKITKWLKKQALLKLAEVTEFQFKLMQSSLSNYQFTKLQQVQVRDYKRRWGCCSQDGKLSFNWRIIMAPYAVLEYVVIHELAHLQEFNHSRQFWNIVEQYCPDWRCQRQWLNDNGIYLYRI